MTALRPTQLRYGFALAGALLALAHAPSQGAGVDARPTAAIPIANNPGKGDRLRAGSIAGLKRGLDALAGKDVAGALAARDSLPQTALDRRILSWAIALDGGVASGEIARIASSLPGWPGLKAFRRNSELALYRERPAPEIVVRAFAGTEPETAHGLIVLARAHVVLDDAEAARKALSPFWRTKKLEPGTEAAIIKEFGALIPATDHRFRMERMLYLDRVKSAERVAVLANASELAKAWAAVLKGDKSAGKLLAAVPESQRSAGYHFAEAKHLRRNKKFVEAAAAMLKAPAAVSSDADAWWVERRVLSRELLDAGEPRLAYRIVAAHGALKGESAVDAEFHAGWYALRSLDDPETAARHFARIAEIASGPISRARAYYWLGRAAQAGGPGDAKAHYEAAAKYGTAFYGQLAAQKLGRLEIGVGYPAPSMVDRQTFALREAVLAIRRLEDAGYARHADTLYLGLAKELTDPGEVALLADLAGQRGNHYLALKVGKAAAARGIDVGAVSHPTGAIPTGANIADAGKALAYAVARQESEFNVGAVSGAGALGLLQLLPGTAKDMAKRAGLAYSAEKLTTDAGYNATLGAAFLGDQLGRFEGSYVLTFAGYNAGPRRAREWVARYGDPRGKPIDEVVDWVERIPFSETRAYVQRVMENYQVYKMQLSGKFDLVGDLVNGRS
jgi:soluble lytic murein transglycosylase